jgi:hypothetical protein
MSASTNPHTTPLDTTTHTHTTDCPRTSAGTRWVRTPGLLTAVACGAVVISAAVFPATPAAEPSSTPRSASAAGTPTSLPTAAGDRAVQQLKEQGAYDSLQSAVAAARYELRRDARPALDDRASRYHAPNPAQKLNALFSPDGLHLAPHKTNTSDTGPPAWRTTMTLHSYGYGSRLRAAGVATLQARGNRVEYRRAGLPLTEWYVNTPTGIEQGFTLDAPPKDGPSADPLRLVLEVTGDLRAELTEEGRAIALNRADGQQALRYGGLYAFDAGGRTLPSRMSVSDGRVILEVDDAGAAYPVTIDPVFTQQAKLLQSAGGTDDQFGQAIAIDLNTVVVGAPFDDFGMNAEQGVAYVFLRSGAAWNLQAILTASDGAAFDFFGRAVAIEWNTIVVGASNDDIVVSGLNRVNQGSAYVFERSGTTWGQQAKLMASDGDAGDQFGFAVTIDAYTANNIVVGAPFDDVVGNVDRGSAYVFVRNGAAWAHQQKLVAPDGAANDHFGWSVAHEGFTAGATLIGAPDDDVVVNGMNQADQGSAYMFVRTNGSWNQQQKLAAGDGLAGDGFGIAVSMTQTGNRIVVGAPKDDTGSNLDQGSAYVYVKQAPFWNQLVKLVASDGANNDFFGWSVDVDGYEIIVGAPLDNIDYRTDQGSAYMFLCNSSSCPQQQKLTAGDGASNDLFGESVAVATGVPSTVAVGAPQAQVGSIFRHGAAYVFVR